jgi:predicted NAD/FAD-binding protein
MNENNRMKIAIVGSGISGLGAAWALNKVADVVVYEAAPRLGGHSATVDVKVASRVIPVDTGFIVYNTLNYPNLTGLFQHLGVRTEASDMSFGVSIDSGRTEWAGSDKVWKVFAQPTNLFDLGFLRMLKDVFRFNKHAVADFHAGKLEGLSLGAYLERDNYRGRFVSDYLVPMGAAIWSTPVDEMLNFPAESFVAFFDNHRLLGFDRPVWRTVSGGSREYVKLLSASLDGKLRLGTAVKSIVRDGQGLRVADASGHVERFDHVVLATHGPEAHAVIDSATLPTQKSWSSVFRTLPNDVWLHGDDTLMPKRRAAWSSWNYLTKRGEKGRGAVALTYWMNLLQNIDASIPLFVSLNPPREPSADKVYGRFAYDHPQFDRAAFDGQKALPSIQGQDGLWFCGAWTSYGFHEDGLRSGIAVAEALGASYPWRTAGSALTARPLGEAA